MIKLPNQSIGRLNLTQTKKLINGLAASVAVICMLTLAVATASAARRSFNNWHVHDGGTGTTDASGLTHRGVGFFPKIFTGGDVAAYKSDPSLWAYCPNATDKTLLHPDGELPGENLRDGNCVNAWYIIHLKSVPEADVEQVPDGWTAVPNFQETVAGTVYKTFYLLTPY
ncbi:MAG: hypothetical protein DME26_21270 [Verrucomicrobia bacterium]|nr:MAG: hypothetical protein DME26_21270 [Verrucomicrobiota bacterium]